MKRLKLLATFIFLAHNAWAGWHTNEPFVAWPATNHLRWMTNVVVATNASHWTNSAYGQWTNNYVFTNIWTWYDDYNVNYANASFYYDFYESYSPASTGMFFNAKEIRIMDCTFAALERWVAAGNDTNEFGMTLFDPYEYKTWEMFYRNESKAHAGIKRTIAMIATNYYRATTNGPAAWEPWDTTALALAAGGPSNFFYDPLYYGAKFMTRGGGRYYSAILTNTWTLSTTNSGVVTNTFIDSWGAGHSLAGTNGQVFTAIVTNANIQIGKTMDDYTSWDTLKAAITNLTRTAVTPTWGATTSNKWDGLAYSDSWFGTNTADAWRTAYSTAADIMDDATNISTSSDAPMERSSHFWMTEGYYTRCWARRTSIRNKAIASISNTNIPLLDVLWIMRPVTISSGTPWVTDFYQYNLPVTNSGAWFAFATNTGISSLTVTSSVSGLAANYVLTTHRDPPESGNYSGEQYDCRLGWVADAVRAILRWDFVYK